MSQTSMVRCQAQTCREPIAARIGKDLYFLANTLPIAVLRTGEVPVRCGREGCGTITNVAVGLRPAAARPLPAIVERQLTVMSPDDIVKLMEERWEAFRLEKLRKRGTIAVGLRFDVFMRDGFRCRYCGASADDGVLLHADHVVPESKGGPTTLDNLATACMDCNLGKSDKDLPA